MVLSAKRDGVLGPLQSDGVQPRNARRRKTIGGIEYEILEASNFDPELSNGVTAMPNEDMISTANSNKYQVSVRKKGPEKAAYVMHWPLDFRDKNMEPDSKGIRLSNQKSDLYYSLLILGAKAGSNGKADTLKIPRRSEWPVGAVAVSHGHIDGVSLGMADEWDVSTDPKLYGDIDTLRGPNPVPTATVSKGKVGWHQIENGRMQFMYPVGALSPDDEDAEVKTIRHNLDRQKQLFHRRP